MKYSKQFLLNIAFKFFILSTATSVSAEISVNFYSQSCPNVEQIVFNILRSLSAKSNVVAPATLRLFFHDCFLEGCDASIMIRSTLFNVAERDLPENNIAKGAFDAINAIKTTLERSCPGVVSCSDIIAMAARDAVVLLGGPNWPVLKGRLDGMVSQASRSAGKMPASNMNTEELIESFRSIGLSVEDMVVLSGSHTVGFARCKEFTDRLYHFGPFQRRDPTLERGFARTLEFTCPPLIGNPSKFQALDANSPFVFDNSYYKNLMRGRGVLFSDQVLFSGFNSTRELVMRLASSQELFLRSFAESMIKLGYVGVKTDRRFGEIRRDCDSFNRG